MEYEQYSNTKVLTVATGGAYTGPWTAANLDTYGFESAMFVIGGIWTSGTGTLVLEHADDDGTGAPGAFTAVDPSDIVGDMTLPSAFEQFRKAFSYRGKKQWLRLAVTEDTPWGGNAMAVFLILQNPRILPIT